MALDPSAVVVPDPSVPPAVVVVPAAVVPAAVVVPAVLEKQGQFHMI